MKKTIVYILIFFLFISSIAAITWDPLSLSNLKDTFDSIYASITDVQNWIGTNSTADRAYTDTRVDSMENLSIDDITASNVTIKLGSGSPTIDQVQEYLDNTGSSGFFLGGDLSDGGAGTLDVAAGSGFIRTTNDKNAELQSFKWSASAGISVTDNTTQYVYVDDDGVISINQDEFLERPDLIQIGVVVKESGAILHAFKLGVRLEDSIGEAGRFLRRVLGISRNNRLRGLILGQSGDVNRDVTMTAGQLEWGRTSYIITAFDTSGTDNFSTYSASGEENATASNWDNLQYDNSGTLTALANNRWANHFVYLEPDNHLVFVYGREQFTTEAQAENEAVPSSSLPTRITETSILIGRFIFQESSNTATILTNFPAGKFDSAGVTSYSDLANLPTGTCTGDDKFSAFDGTTFTCSADQTASGAGTGLWDLFQDNYHRFNQSRTTGETMDVENINSTNLNVSDSIFLNGSGISAWNEINLTTTLTADEANVTIVNNVIGLLPLDLAQHINTLVWITAQVAALDNFWSKAQILELDYRNSSEINKSIEVNMTNHQTNFKHGNTTAEIQNVAVGGDVSGTVGNIAITKNYNTTAELEKNVKADNATQADTAASLDGTITENQISNLGPYLPTTASGWLNTSTQTTTDIRVGIGTTTPAHQLEVSGSMNVSYLNVTNAIIMGQIYINQSHTCYDYPTLANCQFFNGSGICVGSC